VLQLQLMYPHATLWLVGHSLGGSLASLLGATFGLPAVAFEAPGEKIAAQRLHLPPPPAGAPVTHVYHNADPIAVGTCTGPLSVCEQAGYAIETKCHLGEPSWLSTSQAVDCSPGKSIVYDAAAELGWMPDVRHHVIREVITRLLDDDRDWEEGRQVPLAREEEDCSVSV
jgi:lipase ATG15